MDRARAEIAPAAVTLGGDSSGLVFSHDFDADGARTGEEALCRWRWRSYSLTDARGRRSIESEPSLPREVRASLLSGASICHLDFEDGWLFGEIPDLHHEHYSEARAIGHFRFALSEDLLISGRRQPLQSVEEVRRGVERGAKRYRRPLDLLEQIMTIALDQLGRELAEAGRRLDAIEDGIVSGSTSGEREELSSVRRQALVVHRNVATVAQVLRHLDHVHGDELPQDIADMAAKLSHRAQTLHGDGEQIHARARLLQDELMAQLTAQSNRLLYVLSAMTAVLLPMTIVSGLFGMNVGGLPFLDDGAGFWIVTGLSVAVAILVLLALARLSRSR